MTQGDRQIEALLRAAGEAAAFEAPSTADAHRTRPLRLVGDPRRLAQAPVRIAVRRRTWLAAAGSMAAALGITALWYGARPAPVAPPIAAGPMALESNPSDAPLVADADLASRVVSDAARQTGTLARATPGDEPCVVLVIYRTDDGSCVCWTIGEHDLGAGRSLAAVNPKELLPLALANACTPTMDEMIVVAMQGPAESLPRSDERASALAECVVGADPGRAESPASAVIAAALACLPEGVNVLADRIATR